MPDVPFYLQPNQTTLEVETNGFQFKDIFQPLIGGGVDYLNNKLALKKQEQIANQQAQQPTAAIQTTASAPIDMKPLAYIGGAIVVLILTVTLIRKLA